MFKKLVILSIAIFSTLAIFSQNLNEAQNLTQYQKSVEDNPRNRMANIVEEIPTISPLSESVQCFVREPVALQLGRIQNMLNDQGLTLVVDDCYTPISELTADDDPFIQSRGCSVVVLLKDIDSNEFVFDKDDVLEKVMNRYGFTKNGDRWDIKIFTNFELLDVSTENF